MEYDQRSAEFIVHILWQNHFIPAPLKDCLFHKQRDESRNIPYSFCIIYRSIVKYDMTREEREAKNRRIEGYTLQSSEVQIMIIQSGKGLAAEIDLLGAQLVRLWDIETGTEYLWTGDSRYWKRHAPILFPFVGRLTEGVYRYGSQTYEMQIHGFLSHCEFECSAMESDSAEFVFSSCGRPDWPFSFRFTADYHLEERSLGFNLLSPGVSTF